MEPSDTTDLEPRRNRKTLAREIRFAWPVQRGSGRGCVHAPELRSRRFSGFGFEPSSFELGAMHASTRCWLMSS